MRVTLLAILLLTAPVLAGCIESGSVDDEIDPDQQEPEAFIDPITDEHDHGDPAQHADWTPSMEQLGYDMMGEDGKPFSYIGEIDTRGDYAYVIVIGRGSEPGFVVVDVANRTDPEVVGRGYVPTGYVVDVKVDDANEYVYLASQGGAPSGADPRLATDEAAQGRMGLSVWDVRDKTSPELVTTVTAPDGCHMLAYKQISGGEYVFCMSTGVIIYEVQRSGGDVSSLLPVSHYHVQSTEGAAFAAGEVQNDPVNARFVASPHDMTLQDDPLTGDPIMVVSSWDLGARIVDVSNPRQPVELGVWDGEGAENYIGNVHSAMVTAIDGKRYVVAGPELLSDNMPALFILNAEDYGDMTLAGEWTAPGMHTSQGLMLTTHQFQVVDGRIYLAYNHAGVWVLDIATILEGEYAADPARPDVLGYYLPHEDVEPYNPETAIVPNTWDVNVVEGYIYATDRYTGLYVLHYVPDELGDETLTSFA